MPGVGLLVPCSSTSCLCARIIADVSMLAWMLGMNFCGECHARHQTPILHRFLLPIATEDQIPLAVFKHESPPAKVSCCKRRPERSALCAQVKDPSWRELLRFCALRGAYRGAGSELMAAMLRADGAEGGLFGFANALTEEPQGDVSQIKSHVQMQNVAQ